MLGRRLPGRLWHQPASLPEAAADEHGPRRAAVIRRTSAADKVRRAGPRLLAPRPVCARLPRYLWRDALGYIDAGTQVSWHARQRSGEPLTTVPSCRG